MNNRDGDVQEKVYFRSERFFSVNEQWFFSTREGEDVGPFPSKGEAERGLMRFIECVKNSGKSVEAAKALSVTGIWASNQFR